MRARVLLIAVTAALVGFAPAPLPRQQRQRADPGNVEGTWAFVQWDRNGVPDQGSDQRYQVRMTADSFHLLRKEGETLESFAMRLEPQLSPPGFSWSMSGRVILVGSYRLRGDELTMILTRGDRMEARPTDFTGPCLHRFVLRRVKR